MYRNEREHRWWCVPFPSGLATPFKSLLVKARVYVRQKWVDETGSGEIFKSANDNLDRVNLVIPVNHFDISDHNFVEILFCPRALADQSVDSSTIFLPL